MGAAETASVSALGEPKHVGGLERLVLAEIEHRHHQRGLAGTRGAGQVDGKNIPFFQVLTIQNHRPFVVRQHVQLAPSPVPVLRGSARWAVFAACQP